MQAPSGSGPTWSSGPAPWALPKVCPPAISADRLLVVHRHVLEGLADVPRRQGRVRVAVRPFRIHVDQAHVVGAEGALELAVLAVALIVEPRRLGTPVRFVRLPDVRAAEGEAEGLEPHGLQRAVAGEDVAGRPRRDSGHTSS